MEEKIIKLNKENILKLKITTSEGKDTGEYLYFDIDDIDLPFKCQEMLEKEKNNRDNYNRQIIIINKRQDSKDRNGLSRNELEKAKATRNFILEEEKIFNIFLGENGVKKLLNGRKLGWTSLAEIDEIIKNQIMPYLNLSISNFRKSIVEKYKEKEEVLK